MISARGTGGNVGERILFALTMAALAFGAVSCGQADADDAGGLTRVRVISQPYLTYAALRVAEAEGYFAEQGLDVELVTASSSEDAIPLLINGSVDVLPGHLAPGIFNAIRKGFPLRAITITAASSSPSCSSLGILRGPTPSVDSADIDAPIRRISISRQTAMRFVVERLLEHVGLDLSELERVYLPHAIEPDALAAGEVDAALSGEPFMSQVISAGKGVLWIPIEDALPGFQYSFVFYGERLLVRERTVGERFAAAYLKAARRLADGSTDDNVELVARVTGIEPNRLKRMCWPFNPTDGRVDLASIELFQDWLVENELITERVPEERLWDPEFVEKASQALGYTGRNR
jgi:NitT/TauT family transport system substrate-binding protein